MRPAPPAPPLNSIPSPPPSPLHLRQVLYAMRGQATAFAVLVAHQACPVRSVRTHAENTNGCSLPCRTRLQPPMHAVAGAR